MTRTITMTHDYQLNQRASETTRLGVRNVKRAKSFEFLRLLPTSRLFKTMGNNHKSGSPLGAQKFKSKMGNNHLQTTLASMGNNHNVYIYFFLHFWGKKKIGARTQKEASETIHILVGGTTQSLHIIKTLFTIFIILYHIATTNGDMKTWSPEARKTMLTPSWKNEHWLQYKTRIALLKNFTSKRPNLSYIVQCWKYGSGH